MLRERGKDRIQQRRTRAANRRRGAKTRSKIIDGEKISCPYLKLEQYNVSRLAHVGSFGSKGFLDLFLILFHRQRKIFPPLDYVGIIIL